MTNLLIIGLTKPLIRSEAMGRIDIRGGQDKTIERQHIKGNDCKYRGL